MYRPVFVLTTVASACGFTGQREVAISADAPSPQADAPKQAVDARAPELVRCDAMPRPCPGAICVDSAAGATCGAPTCEALRDLDATKGDGLHTLYAGAADRPFQAYCQDMATGAATKPRTYLNLDLGNASTYRKSGATLVTTFTKARLLLLEGGVYWIDATDVAHATSTPGISYTDDNGGYTVQVNHLALGTAVSCAFQQAASTVSLAGTPFRLEPNAFKSNGYMATTSATDGPSDKVTTLTASGNCGWISAQSVGFRPVEMGASVRFPLQWSP